jgi:type I restriction enzyme, S subunit
VRRDERPSSQAAEPVWKRSLLADLGDLFCGQSPPTGAVNTMGNGTLYVTGPEQWDGRQLHSPKWTTEPKRIVPEGCIFITVKGAGVGKLFPGIACAIGRDIYAFKPHSSESRKFVEYALRSSISEVLRHASGDIPGLSKAHILDHEISVPELPEQERIVGEIEKQFSRLDEAVANLKRVKANLKRYKAAVLKAAVEGRLVLTEAELARPEGRSYETGAELLQRILETRRSQWKGKGKYKEPAAPATTDLAKLPEGWVWSTFEFVADRVTVGHVGPMKDEYVERGVPFLRSQNVRANRFDPDGLKYVSEAFHHQLGKSALRPGDIVVVRSGSVGVSCVIPDHLAKANCSDLVIVKAPRGVLPAFGAYYMNSVVETRVAAGKVGVALTHFNTQSVAELPVPVPPIAEQHRIVVDVDRRLSFVREVEAEVDANLKRAQGLRQASLQAAFFDRSGQQTRDGEGKSTPSRE